MIVCMKMMKAVIAIDTVSGADATESGTQSVTVTITENESAPTVTLAVSATSIAENAGSSLINCNVIWCN